MTNEHTPEYSAFQGLAGYNDDPSLGSDYNQGADYAYFEAAPQQGTLAMAPTGLTQLIQGHPTMVDQRQRTQTSLVSLWNAGVAPQTIVESFLQADGAQGGTREQVLQLTLNELKASPGSTNPEVLARFGELVRVVPDLPDDLVDSIQYSLYGYINHVVSQEVVDKILTLLEKLCVQCWEQKMGLVTLGHFKLIIRTMLATLEKPRPCTMTAMAMVNVLGVIVDLLPDMLNLQQDRAEITRMHFSEMSRHLSNLSSVGTVWWGEKK